MRYPETALPSELASRRWLWPVATKGLSLGSARGMAFGPKKKGIAQRHLRLQRRGKAANKLDFETMQIEADGKE